MFDEEPDVDKIILALNSVKTILENCKAQGSKESKMIELSANSSYFLGRIGGYEGTLNLLKDVGFDLHSKPFTGLTFSMKFTQENRKKVNEYISLLKTSIEQIMQARTNEQFLPDYELN